MNLYLASMDEMRATAGIVLDAGRTGASPYCMPEFQKNVIPALEG